MRKSKNILFLESGSGFGGSSKCLYLLLKHIDANTFASRVLYYNFGPNIEAIKKLGIDIQKYSFFTLLFSMWHSEVAYINNELYSHIANIILAKVFKKSCICHIRGIRPLTRAEKIAAKMVNKFIAVSNTCKENLIKEGIPAENIEVIYDGIEQGSLPPRPFQADARIQIGVVGRISRNKGHETFVKAAKKILSKNKEIEFIVIGDDVNEGKPTLASLQLLVKEYRLEGKVIFKGWESNINKIYQGLDIVVCPSLLNEALGNVVLEAMVYAKPIVASDSGAYPEMIQDGITGLLFKAGDENGLADKITMLIQDEKLKNQLAAQARISAQERFDISVNVNKIETVLRKVCSA